MRRYSVPDCLAGLGLLRQHMPIVTDTALRSHGCPIQRDVILTGAAMPDQACPHPTIKQISPCRPLIGARCPAVWKPCDAEYIAIELKSFIDLQPGNIFCRITHLKQHESLRHCDRAV